jgi:leucyl aminopeptidase
MKIQLVTKPFSEIRSDCMVLPIAEGETNSYPQPVVKEFLKTEPKFGKLYESQILFENGQKIMLLGMGKVEKYNFAKLQNWVGTAVKQNSKKTKLISISLPKLDNLTADQIGEAAAIGAEIALLDPAEDYKSEHEKSTLTGIELVVERADRGLQDGIKKGQLIAEGMNLVRRLGDMPANDMTPTYFLNEAKRVAKENKLKITILNELQAKKKGMGAFVGVAQGSEEPSYMIALEYAGNIRTKEKWGLVGKGITFDTGGLSLKPAAAMLGMKYDMVGAATALASIATLAKLKSKVNVVAVMAVTENLPNGRALKPNDIVKTYSGKTAEILNTDAEGRLVLIDAVAYAQKDFNANKIIDLATLTGAMIVALGDNITGVFSNNEEFANQLIEAGKLVGERHWPFPMDEDFNEMIKSDFADITNIGHGGSHPSAAGSITGAKFIEAGIENDTPWIHLDIAGTADDMKPKQYRGVGATGVEVKTLIQLINS